MDRILGNSDVLLLYTKDNIINHGTHFVLTDFSGCSLVITELTDL